MENLKEMESSLNTLLSYGHDFNRMLINKAFEHLTQEDSLRRPTTDMSCPNWILGHIVVSRSDLLSKMAIEADLPTRFVDTYKKGSDGNPNNNLFEIGKIQQLFHNLDGQLVERIEKLDASGDLSVELSELILSYFLHESYHIGQIGLYRRYLGKETL